MKLVKQDGRHLDPKSKLVGRLEDEIPRDTIMALLEPDDNPNAQRLLALMQDPGEQKTSLSRLVYRSQLNYSQLVAILCRNGHAIAAVKTAARLPALVDDIAVDAFGSTVVCGGCDGAGRRVVKKVERTCSACHGSGTVRIMGDKDARDQLLESSGMIGRHGPGVAVNVNMGSIGIETPEQEVASVERALTARTIEVDPS